MDCVSESDAPAAGPSIDDSPGCPPREMLSGSSAIAGFAMAAAGLTAMAASSASYAASPASVDIDKNALQIGRAHV